MADAPDSNELTALAVNLASALRAVHGAAASPNCLVDANRLYNQARSHPKVDILAFQLTAPTAAPEVQHCGFQLVLDRLRQPSGLGLQARSELKNWLVASLTPRRWSPEDGSSSAVPPYVRAKCGEAIAEIARGDWPEYWPELKPALMAAGAGASPELAALALNVWSQICDLLAEEAKDLTVERRNELGQALTKLMKEPESAPELIVFLQESLTRHGGNKQVVWEALRFCETLVSAVPVRLLLQNSLDKILQVGLEIAETRELAVSALASWVDCVCPNKADPSTIPETPDLCRFTAFLTRLARRCQFDGSEQNYNFHRQVTELLTDLCANSASNLCQVMPHAELRDVWGALLHLLRYPSLSIQFDSLVAMIQLVKAQDKVALTSSGPPWPPMEQLLSTLYVHMFKLELWQAEPDDPVRSSWRLSCLGTASSVKQPQSWRMWHQFLTQTHAFDLREGEANAEERSHLFGSVKGKVNDLVTEVCKVAHSLGAGEGYASVCQVATQLALRALAPSSPLGGQNPSVAEFDAAAFLVERPGPAMLRVAAKEDSRKALDAIVEPSLAFLKQVTPAGMSLTRSLEHRRLEFISHWAPFYGHFDAEVVGQVLQRIVAIIEQQSTDDEGISLQRRALDTLVNLGRSGALRPSQLEALNAECPRLALRLPPQSRGKLIEALAAAVAACGEFTHTRRAQLIAGMMEQATSSWASLELVQADARGEKLAEVLVAAAVVGKAGERHSDAQLAKLRDIRTLAHIFIGVVNRTGNHSDAPPDTGGSNGDARMSDAGDVTEPSGHHLAAEVVKAWAPGMFSLATSVAALNTRVAGAANSRETSEAQAVLAALLGMPGENEHAGMLGRKPEIGEEAASARSLGNAVPFARARPARGLLWDLRVASAKGVHACTSCRDFWGFPQAIPMLATLAGMLPSQRPHVAELLLREVFMPVFGPRAGSGQVAVLVPAPVQQPLCSAVLPILVQGISQLLCTSWQGSPSDRGLPVPPEFEGGFASSVLAFSREAAFLLTAMSGSQLPQAVSLVNPERWLWRDQDAGGKEARQLSPQRGRRKKNRNSNRFASLADDDMGTPQAPRGRAAPLTPGTPPSPGKPTDSLPARGMPTTIMTDRALREPVRACMVQMLKLPDVETVQRVIVGLAIWQAQLWNMAATGKLVMTEGGPLPEPGELLHAAVEALRGLPRDVLQPLRELVVRPLTVEVSAGDHQQQQQHRATIGSDATSRTFTLPCSALAGMVRQSWTAFTAPTRSNGKFLPSNLVLAVTQPIWMTLSVLTKLFAMQCRRLQHKPGQEHLYICPSLIEALEICKSLPSTTEEDVAKLLNRMIDRLANMDSQRSDIRALLHAASQPFRDNHDV